MLEKIGIHFIDLERLRDGAIIVDAGACNGNYIKELKGRVEKCKIIAIECDRDNLKILREKNFPNVTICSKALIGYKPKEKMVYHKYVGLPYSGTVGYEKTYIKKRCHYKEVVKYEIETLEINDIFSELGIDRIDFLKMNIEGSERDVLAAMTEETASKIDQISVSIHANILADLTHSSLKESARTDAIERLSQLGFKAWQADRRLTYGAREA